MVTSGDRPASWNASSASTACVSRSTVAGGCATCIDARVITKSTSKRRRAQPSNASQLSLLTIDQRLRPVRAITSQVCLGIIGKPGGEMPRVRRNAIDRRVGESGQRHGLRIDRLLRRRAIRRRSRRPAPRSERPRRRVPEFSRPAVEADRPAVAFALDLDLLPEPLHWSGRSCSSHARLSSRGANIASITPRIATIAPTCGQPPGRTRSV